MNIRLIGVAHLGANKHDGSFWKTDRDCGGQRILGAVHGGVFRRRRGKVTILSRSKPSQVGRWSHVAWDGRTLGKWQQSLDGADAVVNLAGRTVNCVKTPDNQDEIVRSRVESTRVLGEAVRVVHAPPPVWVQMSTAHIYGDPPSAVCDEESAEGVGFAPTIGRAWEEAFARVGCPVSAELSCERASLLAATVALAVAR